jgi:hypothetical protein
MNIFNKPKKNKKMCKHLKNFQIIKTITEEGIPYLDHTCFDCGYKFQGKIYVEPKEWKCRIIFAENGYILIDKIPRIKNYLSQI